MLAIPALALGCLAFALVIAWLFRKLVRIADARLADHDASQLTKGSETANHKD